MIPSIFFGYGEKNWSQSTGATRNGTRPISSNYDYNPDEAKKLLAGLGFKDANGDGVLEDTRGNPVSFTLKTNGEQRHPGCDGELHQGRPGEDRHHA